MIFDVKLESKTGAEIRTELVQYGIELPQFFDYQQHSSVTIDTDKKKIIAAVKKH